MPNDHNYFNDDDANNEVDAMRAACRAMNRDNLWMFAQRALLLATESQRILKERFPKDWENFDRNVFTGTGKQK